jgi:hypothetical protein
MIKELFLHRPRIRKITPKTPTNTDAIAKVVNRNNIKKLLDQISCNLLNAGAHVLNKHIITLLNNTIKHNQFPNRLKEAQVVPLHKKLIR